MWSALVSSILPLVLKKVRIDPAVVSAPMIATIVDGTGLMIYFMIAHRRCLSWRAVTWGFGLPAGLATVCPTCSGCSFSAAATGSDPDRLPVAGVRDAPVESHLDSRSNHRDQLLEILTRFPRRLHVGTHHHHAVRRARTPASPRGTPSGARRCRSAATAPSPKRSRPVTLAGPHLARQGRRPRTDVVCGGPARRQPGADRPDEPGPQAPHVRPAGPHGLQGDRGRLPVGQPDRLRLRPRDHHRGRDSRRRHHPGADAVPARS